MISFKGIDPAVLILALYQGTRPLGMGHLHNTPSLTVEQVREEFREYLESERRLIRIDYYRGRPLKVSLDLTAEEFDERLYDRDAGRGAAADIVDGLRGCTR